MPAGSGTLQISQQVTFLSQSAPALGMPGQIPIQFPGSLGAAATTSLSAGTGAAQYRSLYAVSGTTAGTTPIVKNLTATLVQPDGSVATFADLIAIMFSCPAANTDYITLGAGTDPVAWLTTGLLIYPGMTMIVTVPQATGLAVTATTGDRITWAANSGNQGFVALFCGH